MKGKIGTPCTLTYTRPYWDKCIIKLHHIDKLSPKARVRYKAINLYNSGKYSLIQICEIFEINRSIFYRWRKNTVPSRSSLQRTDPKSPIKPEGKQQGLRKQKNRSVRPETNILILVKKRLRRYQKEKIGLTFQFFQQAESFLNIVLFSLI